MRNDGDDLEWVAEAAKKRGQAVPTIVKKRPKVRRDLDYFWTAFHDLLTDTDFNGNIRWTALDQYSNRYPHVPFDSFRYIIRAMEKVRRDEVPDGRRRDRGSNRGERGGKRR